MSTPTASPPFNEIQKQLFITQEAGLTAEVS